VFEEKTVEIQARESKTVDAQLEVALEEEQVTIDDRNISTDSDNNANAVVLRGRELEALPNDPQSLLATLQAMAGPVDPEGGQAQVKVDGFSNGQLPPKEAIREIRINNNPFRLKMSSRAGVASRSLRNPAQTSGTVHLASTSPMRA
jgi:hypothetical protein